MDKTVFELAPGLWADYRRALWLEQERLLAVSDLHLGFTWAHRRAGQLMPVARELDEIERLVDLARVYRPSQILILGDIVHGAVDCDGVERAIQALLRDLGSLAELRFIQGNHDRLLARQAHRWMREGSLVDCLRLAGRLFCHGHEVPRQLDRKSDFLVIGHEHPVISLGDGLTSQKFPCFLRGENVIVLPAFSSWAAGSDFRQGFLSPLLPGRALNCAVAILGMKLLPIPLGAER